MVFCLFFFIDLLFGYIYISNYIMFEGYKMIFVWVYRLWNWVFRFILWLILIVSMLIFIDVLLLWLVTFGVGDNIVYYVF